MVDVTLFVLLWKFPILFCEKLFVTILSYRTISNYIIWGYFPSSLSFPLSCFLPPCLFIWLCYSSFLPCMNILNKFITPRFGLVRILDIYYRTYIIIQWVLKSYFPHGVKSIRTKNTATPTQRYSHNTPRNSRLSSQTWDNPATV